MPDRFNFTRDVVEALARDPKRRALTFLGKDGVIEPRTFHEISEGATVWAATLTERGIGAGDRVLVVSGSTVDWLEVVLGVMKIGAVVVPCMPTVSALDARAAGVADGRCPRRRRRVARADHRAHGLRTRRPSLRGGPAAKNEGRPRERADLGHGVPRSRVHRLDGRCGRDAQGRRAHARLDLRDACPGRALARRGTRRRGLVHRGDVVGVDDVEHRGRSLVARRRGGAPAGPVRRRRAARPPFPARPEHPLPIAGRVPCARRAPQARALPLAAAATARLHG